MQSLDLVQNDAALFRVLVLLDLFYEVGEHQKKVVIVRVG